MQPIVTQKDKCRKCYSCVRSCPVKALKLEQAHTEVIFERCIGCGNCLGACPQKAKMITDKMGETEKLLEAGLPVIAVLGCSFPTFYHQVTPGKLVTGLKKLGFAEVHEGANGAELIASAYAEAIAETSVPLISSHCPAIVELIERHHPKLIDNLVKVVSPMVAMGRFLKSVHGSGIKVVYISSCIAAKFEIQSEGAQGAIDVVLTYTELEGMLKNRSINLSALTEQPFDGIQPRLGRLFPIAGGPFKAFSIATDPLDTEIATANGQINVMGVINELAATRISPRIVDLRFCYHGCIGSPGENKELTAFFKRKLIINHYKREFPYRTEQHYLAESGPVDVSRTFAPKHVKLPVPKGSDIKKILQATNKFTRNDEMNCRACGYKSCREYAVAVFQGLANLEMCLPFNVQQLEEDRGRLIRKYELARRELDKEYGDEFIVGNDARTLETLELIKQVGPTPTTVLIRGESGTGKELAARAIHGFSRRNDKPLVTVNCTTLTDSLLESELFGHRKGAFTGALADKQGLFEAADGGTVFLDEIGDITPKL